MKRKIFVTLILFSLVCSLCYGIVNATENATGNSTVGSTITTLFGGDTTYGEVPINLAHGIIGAILTIVRVIGVTVAVVILMVIGAKYIIASAGDRADIKKYAVKYVIGAIILFSASGLITLIQNFTMNSLHN